jgi:hypothetical protein
MDDGKEQVSEAAHRLAELGAAKGGRARARKLSAEERRDIARQAAEARWAVVRKNPRLPKATHKGMLKIAYLHIPYFVLDTDVA